MFSVNIVYSQFTSLPVRLVTSTGTPHTGQAANIDFTKYPHSFPTDVVSGITVTEVGTAGNYVAKGFTTFQYVKLWLDGVEQTWFDTVLTGNIFTYLQSNYGRLGSSNTWIGANNTFDGALFGGQVTLEELTTVFDVEYDVGSDLYLWADAPNNNTVIWKRYADSVYGVKKWFLDGSDKIRLETGWKLYGRTNSISPIPINTSHFQYAGDELRLNSAVLNADSIKHKNMTVGKDTTWINLGEPVTKWRFLSLKKGFWANAYTVPEWKWVYTSFDESGVLQAMDSMMVINEVTSVDNEVSVSCPYDGTYNKIDSLLLPAGKYEINFSLMWQRPDHNNASQIGVSDTMELALKEQSSAPNSYIARYIRHIETYVLQNNFSGGVLNWSVVHTVSGTPKYIYLYGRYVANALSTALSLGPTATVTRGSITATLIR